MNNTVKYLLLRFPRCFQKCYQPTTFSCHSRRSQLTLTNFVISKETRLQLQCLPEKQQLFDISWSRYQYLFNNIKVEDTSRKNTSKWNRHQPPQKSRKRALPLLQLPS